MRRGGAARRRRGRPLVAARQPGVAEDGCAAGDVIWPRRGACLAPNRFFVIYLFIYFVNTSINSILIQLGSGHTGRSPVTTRVWHGAAWVRPCRERKPCLRGPKASRGQPWVVLAAACGCTDTVTSNPCTFPYPAFSKAVCRGVVRPDYGRQGRSSVQQRLLCAGPVTSASQHRRAASAGGSPTRAQRQRRAGKRRESQALS
ncbi:uncharacterized protein LOC131591842 isoform X1 [Poecile atricapillus]|uniref:uncharacterized protein LOC131591842 isoform X1 n=1 Tax=Poecile atricapillus TaxID=48891 RepID=UPI00273897BE|nr:uncharacterized protein LOC131591842 isoform X1 [Poecile atricapillus]XP_058718926.1 uncharacterized protein LOC131591842 isoform X1 [Poecile atricapillus]